MDSEEVISYFDDNVNKGFMELLELKKKIRPSAIKKALDNTTSLFVSFTDLSPKCYVEKK